VDEHKKMYELENNKAGAYFCRGALTLLAGEAKVVATYVDLPRKCVDQTMHRYQPGHGYYPRASLRLLFRDGCRGEENAYNLEVAVGYGNWQSG